MNKTNLILGYTGIIAVWLWLAVLMNARPHIYWYFLIFGVMSCILTTITPNYDYPAGIFDFLVKKEIKAWLK